MASKTYVSPAGIGSYVTVLEPKADQKGKLKYSLSLLISKSRAQELEPLKQLALEVATAKWGAKAATILANAKYPIIKDGDKALDEDTGKPKQGYAGMLVISARTDRKPQVLDAAKNEIFTDDDETGIYSGCLMRIMGGLFAYEVEGNKGISIGLNGVQLLKRLPRIDGRKNAKDVFEEWKDEGLDADLA